MAIELNKRTRAAAIASIQLYFDENIKESIGNIAAGALLGFFLEEIAPTVYNQAVAQEQLQDRISELDVEVREEEFRYWRKYPARPS